jgi:hypothetical protein
MPNQVGGFATPAKTAIKSAVILDPEASPGSTADCSRGVRIKP